MSSRRDGPPSSSRRGRRDRPGPSVCDLGCGNGTFLAGMAALGFDAVGVEPDDAARGPARARGLDVRPGTAEHLPPDLHGPFDAVVLTHVLEHCLDPLRALANARALLKPAGTLLCETPNNQALGLAWSGGAWRWLDVPRHLNFFTARSLRLACERVGLRFGQVRFSGYTRQFQSEWIAEEQAISRRDRHPPRLPPAPPSAP